MRSSKKHKKDKNLSKSKMWLVRNYGELYSKELEIKLSQNNEKEIFRWFIASVLFGAPIGEKNVKKTFLLLNDYRIDTPDKIINAGWNKLVEILDHGGYTRYDFKTADKLLELAKNLKNEGGLIKIYKSSKNDEELKEKLENLAKGIGDTTINIFLRDMYGIWNVKPKHTKLAIIAAKKLNIKLGRFNKYLDTALIRYVHKNKELK